MDGDLSGPRAHSCATLVEGIGMVEGGKAAAISPDLEAQIKVLQPH